MPHPLFEIGFIDLPKSGGRGRSPPGIFGSDGLFKGKASAIWCHRSLLSDRRAFYGIFVHSLVTQPFTQHVFIQALGQNHSSKVLRWALYDAYVI